MSSKPPKPGFNSTQYEHLMYPIYMTTHDDLHAAATATEPPDHSFFSRANVEDVQAVAAAGGGLGLSVADRFKRWSFEPQRTIPSSDLQNYSLNPLLSASNDHNVLCNSASGAGGGSAAAADMREAGGGGHANLLGTALRASVGDGVNGGFLPLSNSNTTYPDEGYASTDKPQYSTAHADMEILRVNPGHNNVSGSVHLFEDIPSSLTHQSVGLSAPSNYNLSYSSNTTTHMNALPSTSTLSNILHQNNNHQSQFLSERHHPPQWGPSLRTSSAGTHPHAELLLLPGVAESVVEAPSSAATHNAAFFGSNKLDLLHVSSLHDKQAPMALPLGVVGASGGRPPSAVQMWNVDKLDMTVGLGLNDNIARSTLSFTESDHYASMRGAAQSGLSLFLQSPQQRGQSAALSLDVARYNTRSASGSLGVLRNSKYLKATQQMLTEFCNVCKEGNSVNNVAKSSNISNMHWNATVDGASEVAAIGGEEDHGQLSRAFFSTPASSAATSQKSNAHNYNQQLKSSVSSTTGPSNNQQEKTAGQSTPDHQTAAKQLPADERCHLQMRKARLIAMVEELDRRYQQYRDQMQLIITSFESATGMGGAAPYTTLARRAMSRQFRGLRDAISDHIRAVCRMLGEEVSTVPILCRGETPRLRLVDQRLRHQRSLQQIGMLPQQQAWRPQRGLPERSVSVLRAWLFEHFLHPYPKDSEKAMLARLTGLSRNQVSNWFINARVRLWKPMIEEMYVEESKALEMQQAGGAGNISSGAEDDIVGADAACVSSGGGDQNTIPGDVGTTASMLMLRGTASEEQHGAAEYLYAPLQLRSDGNMSGASHALLSSWPQPAHHHYSNTTATNDLHSFIHFHSSNHAAEPPSLADVPSQTFSWMKPHVPPSLTSQVDGDFANIITHTHHTHHQHLLHHHPHQPQLQQMSSNMQVMQHPQGGAGHHNQLSSTTSNFMKNGVSLTLGLQQTPSPHVSTTYNSSTSHGYHVRPSEALLF
ncbi:hypothetical protein GOP47_0000241 [Adiantum capillus-veneris]|uniref:Homeobox domain-containing protein n=1 Tax=Adiantum capillus-veneris TaxID=13818 RepID=A0A9D4VES5_ADICA|nr:hypothetical protein GOP47_0000241 [Adiantum capillus-veneris]